jgi:FkbM family methyltransferase
VFIDLGAFTGDTIDTARIRYPGLDRIYAFEPLPDSFEVLNQRFGDDPSIELFEAAASIDDGEATFYPGTTYGPIGSSLRGDKSDVDVDNGRRVRTVDFARFLSENVAADDRVSLKLDIEGAEYDLLRHMLDSGVLSLVDELFCEWHIARLDIDRQVHEELLRDLRRAGFPLTGWNELDEFMLVAEIGPRRLRRLRFSHRCKALLPPRPRQALSATRRRFRNLRGRSGTGPSRR